MSNKYEWGDLVEYDERIIPPASGSDPYLARFARNIVLRLERTTPPNGIAAPVADRETGHAIRARVASMVKKWNGPYVLKTRVFQDPTNNHWMMWYGRGKNWNKRSEK